MSKLAKKIADAPPAPAVTRKGPPNKCLALYGPGDLEDWEAVETLRTSSGLEWRAVQAHIDELAGIERAIPLEAFRRHWRRFCFCWPEDLRR